MQERLTTLSSADVRANMTRIEPQLSYSDLITHQLEYTVFGQHDAMKAIGRRIALFDTGLGDPQRPLGSMFFLGPSGVGKTEAARAAQSAMGLHDDRLKIINMAEYQQEHYVARFVGSPQGYVGYNEEPAIPHDWLHKGRSIIVFDEIDKAHPLIRQALLGVLDKGTMDARDKQKGSQPLHFNQSLLIFTSNIAGEEIHRIMQGKQGIGFHGEVPTSTQKAKRIQAEATKGLEEALSPEFMNRLDDIIVFNELTDPKIYDRMITKFIDERNEMLVKQRNDEAPYFAVTTEFRAEILRRTTGQGGRQLRRVIEHELFDKAADVFMGIDVKRRLLVVDFDGDVVFYTDKVEEKPIELYSPPVPDVKKKSIPTPQPTDSKDNGGGKGDRDGKDEGELQAGSGDDAPVPEETGDEDIKEPKNMKFFVPMKPRWDTMDLAITIKDKAGKERLVQLVENLPLLPR